MNWKLAIDTFGETYHFNRLHKNSLANDFYGNVQMYDRYGRNHRMALCMKTIDDLRTKPQDEWNVPARLAPRLLPVPERTAHRGRGRTDAGSRLSRKRKPAQSFSQIGFYIYPEMVENESARAFAARSNMSVEELLATRMERFASVIQNEDYVAASSGHRGALSGAQEYLIFGATSRLSTTTTTRTAKRSASRRSRPSRQAP